MSIRDEIFTLLGYPPNGHFNGEPCWDDGGNPALQIVSAVIKLPDNEADFLATDLDTIDFPKTLIELLKTFQCSRIRDLRAAAYHTESDSLYMAYVADGDGKETWLIKREEIKKRYPWPGAYR